MFLKALYYLFLLLRFYVPLKKNQLEICNYLPEDPLAKYFLSGENAIDRTILVCPS